MSHVINSIPTIWLAKQAVQGIASLTHAPKPPAAPALPAPVAPTQTPQQAADAFQQQAADTAQQQVDQRRRTLLQTGGKVDYAGAGGAPILASQTRAPTLLGG